MQLPNVTIAAGINAIEGGLPGEFIITLDAPAPVGGQIVKFAVSGRSTATATTDYTFGAGNNITALTANTFTVAAGATTAVIRVTAPIDGIFDPNETITLNLTDSVKFLPVRTFNAGTQPRSVAASDINGDGKDDLVIANDVGGVSILLSDGNGHFNSLPPISIGGQGASSITVGDLDNDNKPDIVATNSLRDNDLSVLVGNGNGTFRSKGTFPVGAWSNSVTIGRFNIDSKPDLAVANFDDNNISILNGNGDGTFSSNTTIGEVNSPISIAVDDFNEDDKSDLVVANYRTSEVSLISNGQVYRRIPIDKFDGRGGTSALSVTADDFDGDKNADFAVANWSDDSISLFFGKGNGSFDTPKILDFAGNWQGVYSIKTGDFNGDGKKDLAAARFYNNEIAIFLGEGDRKFSTPTLFSLGSSIPHFTEESKLLLRLTQLTVGDFDGDGKSDLARANFDGNNVSVLSS